MSNKKKTTVESTPWAPAQPSIKGSLAGLQTANEQGNANLNATMPGVMGAIAKINDNVANPPAYLTDARSQLDKTINGDFIGHNPYIDHAADLVAQKTGAQYQSGFGAAGRAHGGLAALLSSQGIGDALGSMYGQQYNTERGQQQQAIMAAPGFHADQDNTDLNALLAGASGAALLPGQVANQYAGGVTGVTSPYGTKTQTESSSMLPQLLGMAAQIGGAMAGVPIPNPMAGAGGAGGMSGLINPGSLGVQGSMSPLPANFFNFGLGG